MKRPVIMSLVTVGLAAALVVGVPGVGAEQQARAFAPCNNSITCQPANMPMLVEAGMIKIGTDGLIKTAIATPKVPPASGWSLVDWVGGVIGAAATVVAGWTTRTFIDANGDLGTTDGETMTSEGLPEGQIETAPGHKFTNVNDAKDWESQHITAQYGAGPGLNIQDNILQPNINPPRMKPTYGSFPTRSYELSWNPVRIIGNSATVTYQIQGDYGSQAERRLGLGCRNPSNGVTNTEWKITPLNQSSGGSVTESCVLSTSTLEYVWLIPNTVSARGGSTQIWSSKGDSYVSPSADTQKGTVERTLDCRDTAGVTHPVSNQTVGTMGNGPLPLAPLKCPPGTLPIDTGTTWKPETGEPITIIPKRVTIPKPITEMEKFPDCWGGKCVVTLERADGSSCGKIGEGCPDWSKDPKRNQNYVCKFGGKLVTLNMCSMYRAPEYGVLPNVDKDTGEYLDPSAPVPKDFGKPVTDPKTGNPITAVPGQNQPQKDCRPQSFWEMLNPFAVFQAVQCAITETFVPKADFVKANNLRIIKAMEGTAPALIAAEVAGLQFKVPASSCHGVTLDLRWLGAGYVNVMNACPGSPLEPLVWWSRLLGNIGFSIWGLVAISRHVAGLVNYKGLGE